LNRTMRFGMKGCDILELHNKLTTLGFYKGPIDDKFGRLLLPAVKAFQKANPPLKVDGIVGPLTKAILNK
ncbi:MAG: peptidoglycan-binding domain-containing protein, partial [Candidatus Paceibacterota bacterium]